VGSLKSQAFIFPPVLVGMSLVVINLVADRYIPIGTSTLIITSVLLFAVSLLFSYWNAKRLVRPLIELVPQTDAIAQGKLVVSNHGDRSVPQEVEYLVRAIDQIAEKQARDFAAMQKLERIRSEFLGNVSHELRTPIFAVQGFIETLLDGAVDDPKVNRDFLERAGSQAARLNSLLNDLIDISRIESGEMRMSFRLFDIQLFLREVVRDMQSIAERKHIELYFTGNIRQHHEIMVFGDKDRLKQVMINLIDNAIKYSNEAGSVKVELVSGTPTDQEVTVLVHDTGIGIAQEHLSRLFERFYRVDKDRARSSPGGTGLGLAIVKHIVEAHHGMIKVESTPSVGSTFSFTLHREPF
jgi:two-component system phosphate regulon sensor histidine kinase PhoR